jgi:hypothetical protein
MIGEPLVTTAEVNVLASAEARDEVLVADLVAVINESAALMCASWTTALRIWASCR